MDQRQWMASRRWWGPHATSRGRRPRRCPDACAHAVPQPSGCSPSLRPVCWASSPMLSLSCSVGAAADTVLLAVTAGLQLTQLALRVTTPMLVARRPARSGAAAGPARLPRAAAAAPRHVGIRSRGEPARSSCRKCVARLCLLLNVWSVGTPHLHCACPAAMQRMRTNAFMCSSPMLQHTVWRRRITWVLRIVGHVRLRTLAAEGMCSFAVMRPLQMLPFAAACACATCFSLPELGCRHTQTTLCPTLAAAAAAGARACSAEPGFGFRARAAGGS